MKKQLPTLNSYVKYYTLQRTPKVQNQKDQSKEWDYPHILEKSP